MTGSRRLSTLAAIISVLLLAQPAFSGDALVVRYTAEFSLDDFSFNQVRGYDVARVENGECLAEPGKPMLPSAQIRVALPAGMIVSSVQILNIRQENVPGEFDIFPAQPAREIGASDSDPELVEPDDQIYGSDQPYPLNAAEFVGQTDLAGQVMAVVQLYPLQYLPAEKRLVLNTSITLEIDGVEGYRCGDYLSPNVSEKTRRVYRQMVADMVANPEEVRLITGSAAKAPALLPEGSFDHVIVTSSSYAPYYQPLVDWHNRKGVRDTVVTIGWIYLNYAGADTQKIRNFVVDACSTWGTAFFLMGGENETVPFAYRNYREDTPSDQYYSDFDDDWSHEVFVGRLSAESAAEIDVFLDKVLKYEKDPPRTDYPLDVLLIGMDYDASTHCEELKENIDAYYIPARFNLTKVYDSHAGNHKTAVIEALNAGKNLVNHADHSYIEYMGTGDRNHELGIYSSNVDMLTNDNHLSVVVSTGCHPNHMDYDDCIAEHFVVYNPNRGAVAFTGNTRSGLYYEGDPLSLSNGLEKQWWVSMFFWGKHTLGQILADGKHHFPHSSYGEMHSQWTLNLLGEPAMEVWTDEPDSFQVTHPFWLPPEPSTFPVHVEDATSGNAVDQAYVCLWKENDVYLTGYTDADGDVLFSPSPGTLGLMYVTATKHNYLPFQGGVGVSEYLPGDANADGIVDLGDAVHLVNYLYKSGIAPEPLEAGDANCDATVDLGDVVHLVNYLFKGGTSPGCR